MRIADDAGESAFTLAPVRYEFAEATGDEWDDNWLVVRGAVITPAATSEFEDPSLLVTEAQALQDWLVGVSRGAERPMAPAVLPLPSLPWSQSTPPVLPTLTFVEPNIAFGVVAYAGDSVTVRVFLDAEARPPGGLGAPEDEAAALDIRVRLTALADAASDWGRDISEFPERA
ncbi:WapI family immunity protein [Marisediminicola senii]|uniref:WapI family immunity protein n=1 Tax=Marisediminicola senii TaxID=2711233 RepID=UPI0013EBB4E2|nr:hypothetical protein [Marisediminicola senii]